MSLSLEMMAIIDHSTKDLDWLIHKEKTYNIIQLEHELHKNVPLLNKDQWVIYDDVIHTIENSLKCFFMNGLDGIRKTFLYNTLLAYVRSYSNIIMVVTSFEIAILLINDSRTAHLWFKILINLNSLSTCNILQRSKEACLINIVKLFV